MSLDLYLVKKINQHASERLWWRNVTHNLVEMWDEAGVYEALYESNGKRACEVVESVARGVEAMRADPARFQKHNATNGWGMFKHALPWLESFLGACREYPSARISVSR